MRCCQQLEILHAQYRGAFNLETPQKTFVARATKCTDCSLSKYVANPQKMLIIHRMQCKRCSDECEKHKHRRMRRLFVVQRVRVPNKKNEKKKKTRATRTIHKLRTWSDLMHGWHIRIGAVFTYVCWCVFAYAI